MSHLVLSTNEYVKRLGP